MVIDDLDVLRPAVVPDEAYAPLVVDADAVLAGAVSPERLQAVAGRGGEIAKFDGIVQHLQLTLRHVLDVPKPSGLLALVKRLGILAPE